MPNFQLYKYLRFYALVLFILDFTIGVIRSNSIGIGGLFIPAILQALVISYINRYGNYLNEEDYPKIQSGEWQDKMDTKGYFYGVYCILMASVKLLRGLTLLYLYINSTVIVSEDQGSWLNLLHSIVLISYGTIVIYYVIMTFILLKNRFPKSDDSQILDKDL